MKTTFTSNLGAKIWKQGLGASCTLETRSRDLDSKCARNILYQSRESWLNFIHLDDSSILYIWNYNSFVLETSPQGWIWIDTGSYFFYFFLHKLHSIIAGQRLNNSVGNNCMHSCWIPLECLDMSKSRILVVRVLSNFHSCSARAANLTLLSNWNEMGSLVVEILNMVWRSDRPTDRQTNQPSNRHCHG